MGAQTVRLYGIPFSHPVLAVRGMLEHKRLPSRYTELLAGCSSASLWALGFGARPSRRCACRRDAASRALWRSPRRSSAWLRSHWLPK